MKSYEANIAIDQINKAIALLYSAYSYSIKADKGKCMGWFRRSLMKNIHGLINRREELLKRLPLGEG